MKYCFVCETPYQMLNALSVLNLNKQDDLYADLFIRVDSKKMESIYTNIIELDIFNHVYAYSYNTYDSSKFGRYQFLVIPSRFINMHIKERLEHNYSILFMSTYTKMSLALAVLNRKSEIVFFDDGLGSYIGKIGANTFTKKVKMLFWCKGLNYRKLYPKRMYINNVKMCNNDWNIPIEQIPPIDKQSTRFRNTIYIVFGKPGSQYKDTNVVILSQPLDGINEKEIIRNLDSSNIILRRHPLDKRDYRDVDAKIDNEDNLWELVCEEYIDDQKILIAACSTAQIIPKILFNREPYVIFTYRIFKRYLSPNIYQTFDDLVRLTINAYDEPQRVALPASINELREVFNTYKMNLMNEIHLRK